MRAVGLPGHIKLASSCDDCRYLACPSLSHLQLRRRRRMLCLTCTGNWLGQFQSQVSP